MHIKIIFFITSYIYYYMQFGLNQMSVQELVKNPTHAIPENYIIDQQPVIPAIGKSEFSVPIVDMKRFLDEETRVYELENLHSACKEWGIFQVVNHGLEHSWLLEKMNREIEEFYALPLEDKLKFKNRNGEFEGFGQHFINDDDDDEKAMGMDWVDRFYMITNPIHKRKPHLFPNLPRSLRESLEGFIAGLQAIAKALLGLMAETLKINHRREIEEMFENGMQSVRMNYYPPCRESSKVIRLTPHSDGSAITILHQVNGVGGLQIKKDGVWMPLNFLPQALVVNLGDVVEVLSNGLYKSIEHRAIVNSEKERISIGMFFNPNFEANVGPSPTLLIHQKPNFKTVSMEDYVSAFFSRRLQGKFLDSMRM